MHKKEVFVITLSIFLVFVIGCSKEVSQDSELYHGLDETDIELARAIQTKDVSLCNQFLKEDNDECVFQIYYNWALEEDNVYICNEILDEDLKIACSDNFYFEKASVTLDLSLCNKIVDAEIEILCLGEE
jgi:hypothetical protein